MVPAILFIQFILCSAFLNPCNGVPMVKKATYTEEEEILIIQEIENYPSDTKPIYGRKMWRDVAKSHSRKRKLNPVAFPYERSPYGLRFHFTCRMLKSKGKVAVPQTLFQKLMSRPKILRDSSGNKRIINEPIDDLDDRRKNILEGYTAEEDKFLIDELLNYPQRPVPIYGLNMWFEVEDHHKQKRELDTTGFPCDRSAKALQARLLHMLRKKLKGEEREKLMAEIRRESRKEIEADERKSFSDGYTSEEDRFLIDEVLNYPQRPVPIYGLTMWYVVKDHYKTMRDLDTTKFPHDRSAKALQARFLSMLKKKIKGQERENLMKEIRRETPTENEDTTKIKYTNTYTKQEVDMIMEELLQPYCNTIFSLATLENIKKKHKEKRDANTPGFLYERSDLSLRSFFSRFISKNESVPLAIKQKFPHFFAERDATQSEPETGGPLADSQDARRLAEDYTETWDSMIEELQYNSVQVNFSGV